MMNPFGLFLVVLSGAIPLFWFGPLMQTYNPAGVFSQYLGAVALIWMGLAQLLATRWRGLEAIFGGMDRMYVLHKWLAVVAIGAAALHDTIDAEAGGFAPWPRLEDMAEEWGEIGFYGLLVLIIISLITFIPYHYWKWSHRLIGAFFALAAAHFFFIEKSFVMNGPLGWYISAFCVLGIVSYLYLLIPRRLGLNTKVYEVSEVIGHGGGITEVHLQPRGRGIGHKPGQFSFVNFEQWGLGEVHPYTISSAPTADQSLQFMIKGLGGYTKKLGGTLEKGTRARVSRAFGHFRMRDTGQPQVWIGAGIGITPFLAWSGMLKEGWSSPTTLYYCVPSRGEALYVEYWEALAARVKNFEFVLVVSGEGPRLSAEGIAAHLGAGLKSASVYFCGPVPMRAVLKKGLVARGLRRRKFHYEEFEIRSEVGVRWLLGWIAQRFFPEFDVREVVGRLPAVGGD
ncbi:MAG TPA: ferredoxin reductase family protein [Anaerolineae bacterium]|nr:ferredoxin reductase family protein [Anaerolineae bacterium]